MKGALVGKVCLCCETSELLPRRFNPLMQPYGLFVANGSQGGGQVHARSRSHKLAHDCYAGVRHLWLSRQLHSSRHDFRPNRLQVTR